MPGLKCNSRKKSTILAWRSPKAMREATRGPSVVRDISQMALVFSGDGVIIRLKPRSA